MAQSSSPSEETPLITSNGRPNEISNEVPVGFVRGLLVVSFMGLLIFTLG